LHLLLPAQLLLPLLSLRLLLSLSPLVLHHLLVRLLLY
jgi:hypothetical protein